jgi:hypothetical protein
LAEAVSVRRKSLLDPPPQPDDVEMAVHAEAAGDGARGGGSPEPHASKFHFFTGALIVLAIAALLAATVFAVDGHSPRSTLDRWASFHPSSKGLDTGTEQIADHVGRQYRFPSGEQLVAVVGGPLELQNLPMKIAIRQSPADGGNISLRDGPGVLYRLCGLGPKCALDRGKPAPERHLLLRREALELALYSFHDLDNVQDVVVFMPPAKGKAPTQALHFRRGDVAGQLARPLRATLITPAPTPDTVAKSPDTPFVQNLTVANLFKFSYTQGQDASVFLVLDPLPKGS